MDGVGSPEGGLDPAMLDLRYPPQGSYSPKLSYNTFPAASAAAGGGTRSGSDSYTHLSNPLYSSGFGLTGLVDSKLWSYSPGYDYGLSATPGPSVNSV